MCLVAHYYYVMVRINRLGIGNVEFLNQRENKRRITFQSVYQVFSTARYKVLCLHGTQHPAVLKSIAYLIVQFFTVCQDNYCWRAFKLTSDFSCEEQHRVTFSATLCMPENSQLTIDVFTLFIHFNSLVHSQILMVACQNLYSLSVGMVVKNEVFQQVHEIFFLAYTS